MRYLIILEPTATGYSAYSPDLDGCVAAGDDRDETIALMQEAITFHLEGMAAEGYPLPAPRSESAYIEIVDPGAAEDLSSQEP
ncbi:MAG: type II toxin-antitoxin system HicB family antitoxin [Planctomycetes bacterium]|nr:type II toxin-antitoxin system HicB family antitoxin [Planctomycetota bacterium]